MGLFQRNQQPQSDARWEALNAEYQNYRRRTALELEQAGSRSAQQTILALLPLYDDLTRALASPCTDPAFYRGVEMILQNLLDSLASLGVKPMDSKGKIFNPAYHEAAQQITDPQYRAEEITQVLRVGFTMDDQVIRHARVIVANCE